MPKETGKGKFEALKFAQQMQKKMGDERARSRKVNDELDAAQKSAMEWKGLLDMREFEKRCRRARELLDAKDYDGAMAAARAVREFVDKAPTAQFPVLMKRTEEEISSIELLGVTADDARTILATAKETGENGDIATATKLLKDAIASARETVEYQVSEALSYCSLHLSVARTLELDVSGHEARFEESKKALAEKRYDTALETALLLAEEVGGMNREGAASMVAGAEESIGKAEGSGVDIRRASAYLDKAREALGSKDYEQVSEMCRRLRNDLERRGNLEASTRDLIQALEDTIAEHEKAGAGLGGPRRMLGEAKRAVEAGDFDRALELAEECEATISSATEQRQSAEERVRWMEERVAIMKRDGLPVSRSEELLGEARAAQKDGDEELAADYLKHAGEELAREAGDFLGAYMAAARDIVSRWKSGAGEKEVKEVESLLVQSATALDNGDFGLAFNLAKKAKAKVGKREVQRGEEQPAAPPKDDAAAAKAKEALARCDARIAEIGAMGVPLPPDAGADEIEKGRGLISAGDHSTALRIFTTVMERLDGFFKSVVEVELNGAEQEAASALGAGAETGRVKELLKRAQVALESGNPAEAVKLARQAREEAARARTARERHQALLDGARRLQASFGLAKKMGVDISRPEKLYWEVTSIIEVRDPREYVRGDALLAEATKVIEDAVSGEVAALLKRVEARAASGGVAGGAAESVKGAKESIAARDMEKAYGLLKKAWEAMDAGTRGRALDSLTAAEKGVTEAESVGVDVSKLRSAIAAAREMIKAGKADEATAEAARCGAEAADLVKKGAMDTLEALLDRIEETSRSGLDTKEGEGLCSSAEEALRNDRYLEAYKYARMGIDLLEKKGHDYTVARDAIQVTSAHLDEANALGADMAGAQERNEAARAAFDSGKFEAALAHALDADELVDRSLRTHLTGVVEDASAAVQELEKGGIEAGKALDHLNEAMGAMERREYPVALEMARAAIAEVAAIREQHQTATEVVELARTRAGEAKALGLFDSVMEDMSRLMELSYSQGSYNEAQDSGTQLVSLAEDTMAEKVREAVAELRGFVEGAGEDGADFSGLDERVAEIESSLSDDDYRTAIRKAEVARRWAEERLNLHGRVAGLIERTNADIEAAAALGVDTGKASSLLDDARREMEALHDYERAMKSIEESRKEVEASQKRRVDGILNSTAGLLSRGDGLGADISKARGMLDEARRFRSKEEFSRALQMATEAQREAENRMEEHRTHLDRLKELSNLVKSVGSGGPLLGELLSRAREALAGRDYTGFTAIYDEMTAAAERLRGQKESAVNSLDAARELLEEAEELGVPVIEGRAVSEQASSAMASGDFEKAAELAIQAAETAHATIEKRCTDDIAAAREAVQAAVTAGVPDGRADEWRGRLAGAGSAMGEGDWKTAIESAKAVAEEAGEAGGKVDGVKRVLDEAAEWLALGGNRELADDMLSGARTFIAEGDYEEALRLAGEARDEARKGCLGGIEKTIQDRSAELETLRNDGLVAPAAGEALASASRGVKRADARKALAALDEAAKIVGEVKTLWKEASESREAAAGALAMLRELGLTADRPSGRMKDAGEAEKAGDYRRASALYAEVAKVAGGEARDTVLSHIETATEMADAAGALGADTGGVKKTLAEARAMCDSGEFAGAHGLALQALESAEAARTGKLYQKLSSFEKALETAAAGGLPKEKADEAARSLDGARSALGELNFVKVESEAERLEKFLASALGDVARSAVEELPALIRKFQEDGGDAGDLLRRVDGAKGALAKSEFARALEAANSVRDAVAAARVERMKGRAAEALRRAGEAAALLADMAVEAPDAAKSVKVAEGLLASGDFAGAAAEGEKAAAAAREAVKAELDSLRAKAEAVLRDCSTAGISPDKGRGTLASAREAVNAGRHAEAAGIFRKAAAELEEALGGFRERFMKVEEAGRSLAGAERSGAVVEPVRMALEEARYLLTRGDGAGFDAALEKCRGLLKRAVEDMEEAGRGILELRKELADARASGVEAEGAETLLRTAEAAAENREHARCIEVLGGAKKALEDAMRVQCGAVLAGLERELEGALGRGVRLDRAEEALIEAREAIEENRADEAIQRVQDGREALREELAAYHEAADAMGAARLLLLEGGELGAGLDEAASRLKEAERHFDSGDYTAVADEAGQCAASVRATLKTTLDGELTAAQSQIDDVEALGAPVPRARDRFRRAREAAECDDYLGAWEELEGCRTEAESVRARYEGIMDLVRNAQEAIGEAEEAGMEVEAAEEKLSEVEASVERGDFEKAAEAAKECVKLARAGQVEAAKVAVAEAEKVLQEATQFGEEVEGAADLIDGAKRHLDSGEAKEAKELADEAVRTVGESMDATLTSVISFARAILTDAERMNLQVPRARELLNGATKSREARDYQATFDMAREAGEVAEAEIVAKVEGMLSGVDRLVGDMVDWGTDMAGTSAIAAEARAALEKRLFEEAYQKALSCEDEARKEAEEVVGDIIIAAQKSVEELKESGLDVAPMVETLKQAIEALEEGRVSEAHGRAVKVRAEAMEAPKRIAEEAIAAAELEIKAAGAGVDLTQATGLLTQARAALKSDDAEKAVELARKSTAGVEGQRRASVQKEVEAARRAVAAGEAIGADMAGPKNSLEAAEKLIQEKAFTRAIETVKAAAAGAEELMGVIVDEAVKYCESLVKDGGGSETVADLMAQAGEAGKMKDFKKAYETVVRAIDEAEEMVGKAIAGEISSLDRLVTDFKRAGVDVMEAWRLLQKAKGAMEKKDIEAVRQFMKLTREKMRGLDLEYAKTMDAIESLRKDVEKAREVEPTVAEVEDTLASATLEAKRANFKKAEELLVGARERLGKAYSQAAIRAVGEAETRIQMARRQKVDVKKATAHLQKAKEQLSARDFLAAYQTATMAKDEVGKVRGMRKEYDDLIYAIEETITKASSFGVDFTAAEKLIEHAIAQQDTNLEEALDFVRKAKGEAERATEKFRPELTLSVKHEGSLSKDNWTDVEFTVTNGGKTAAKAVTLSISGDVQVEGIGQAPPLKSGESAKVKGRVKPTAGGDLPLKVTHAAVRDFDGKEFRTTEVLWVKVSDGKAGGKGPIVAGGDQFVKKSVRCYICLGTIKPGFTPVRCACGKTYHETCSSRVGDCPNCGRPLANLVAEEKK